MKVKICGITNIEDGLAAAQAGADFLGLNFYPQSPCDATVAEAGLLWRRCAASSGRLRRLGVGVFVNATPEQVRYTLYTAGLAYAQLHGDETPADIAAQRGRATRRLARPAMLQAAEEVDLFGVLGPADGPGLLVDAYHPAVVWRLRPGK